MEFQAAEARRLMQLNSQRWQQALLPAVQPGKCSTTSLTEPAAFSLATDDRLRGHAHVVGCGGGGVCCCAWGVVVVGGGQHGACWCATYHISIMHIKPA